MENLGSRSRTAGEAAGPQVLQKEPVLPQDPRAMRVTAVQGSYLTISVQGPSDCTMLAAMGLTMYLGESTAGKPQAEVCQAGVGLGNTNPTMM